MDMRFSSDADESQLRQELGDLLKNEWIIDEEHTDIRKQFYFKTYTKCLDFSLLVGVGSKAKNHHPEMTTKNGSVLIYWTTHRPRGFSDKNSSMARYCDEQARLIGTVNQEEAQRL